MIKNTFEGEKKLRIFSQFIFAFDELKVCGKMIQKLKQINYFPLYFILWYVIIKEMAETPKNMQYIINMQQNQLKQQYELEYIINNFINNMSYTQNRAYNQPIATSLMKVNELINSIYATSQNQMNDQLQTCSKIVGQLLQNQLINRISSLSAAKLLCYQLVLLIAEQNAIQQRPRLSILQNAFGNNKKVKFTANLRNTLFTISELLEEMVWQNIPKKKGMTDKKAMEICPLYEGYLQFKQLLNDFDNYLDDRNVNTVDKNRRKPQYEQQQYEQDQNEALIQKLEQIVAKKQKRIKELSQELQQNILDQKAQEDLLIELESRNNDFKLQIRILNQKLAEKIHFQYQLQEKINSLKTQIFTLEKQTILQPKRTIIRTDKIIKSKHAIYDDEQNQTVKKSTTNIFDIRPCMECQLRKEQETEDSKNLRKMLFMQAVSIQAVI